MNLMCGNAWKRVAIALKACVAERSCIYQKYGAGQMMALCSHSQMTRHFSTRLHFHIFARIFFIRGVGSSQLFMTNEMITTLDGLQQDMLSDEKYRENYSDS